MRLGRHEPQILYQAYAFQTFQRGREVTFLRFWFTFGEASYADVEFRKLWLKNEGFKS